MPDPRSIVSTIFTWKYCSAILKNNWSSWLRTQDPKATEDFSKEAGEEMSTSRICHDPMLLYVYTVYRYFLTGFLDVLLILGGCQVVIVRSERIGLAWNITMEKNAF